LNVNTPFEMVSVFQEASVVSEAGVEPTYTLASETPSSSEIEPRSIELCSVGVFPDNGVSMLISVMTGLSALRSTLNLYTYQLALAAVSTAATLM